MSRRFEILQKFIAVLLVIFCLACSLAPAADALGALAGLTIAGQAVMTTGMLNNLLVIGADACGFTNAIRDAIDNSPTAQTIGEFIEEQFSLWRGDYGMALVHALNVAQSGTKYLEDGRLVFDYAMSNMMDSFYQWLWSEEGGNLKEYGTISSSSGGIVNIDNVNLTPLQYPDYEYFLSAVDTDILYIYLSGVSWGGYILHFSHTVRITRYGSLLIICSSSPFTSTGSYINSDGSPSVGNFSSNAVSLNGVTYYRYSFSNSRVDYYNPSVGMSYFLNNGIEGSFNSLRSWDQCYLLLNGQLQGIGDFEENPGAFHLPDPSVYDTNVINPTDSIAFPNYPSDTIDGTMAIGDYLTGLADLIGSAVSDAVISLPIELTDGITSTIELELTDALPIEQAKEADITGAEDATINPSPGDLGPYTIDLRDFFPFCIPFDIYRMLTMFRGSAEAPRFTWRFYVPNVVDQNIVIDLSGFDSAARILRSMELIAFCIGLAFVTKKLIQGGD